MAERGLAKALDEILSQSADRDLQSLDPHSREDIHDRRSLRQLKEQYANKFLWFLGIQLGLMNLVFILTGAGILQFDHYVLHLYMGGTLAEIFGIVLVITRRLFRD